MGQNEILDVLEKSELPMSGSQIAETLGEYDKKIFKLLRLLLKRKELMCIELNRHQALKHFGSKRKLRLYYISTLNQGYLRKAKTTLPYL